MFADFPFETLTACIVIGLGIYLFMRGRKKGRPKKQNSHPARPRPTKDKKEPFKSGLAPQEIEMHGLQLRHMQGLYERVKETMHILDPETKDGNDADNAQTYCGLDVDRSLGIYKVSDGGFYDEMYLSDPAYTETNCKKCLEVAIRRKEAFLNAVRNGLN